jgi:hypothetical protein
LITHNINCLPTTPRDCTWSIANRPLLVSANQRTAAPVRDAPPSTDCVFHAHIRPDVRGFHLLP